MILKMNKTELEMVSTVLNQFDDVTDFTIVREPITGGGYSFDLVFDTTIKGMRGVFKLDLTEVK